MIRVERLLFPWVLLAVVTARSALAAGAPDPREVYEIIRTNLSDITDAQLQNAAVEGLVKELQPRVWLLGNEATTNATGPVLSKVSVFDGLVAVLRIGRVGDDLAAQLAKARAAVTQTNAIEGVVLDLRFADGEDYAAAAAAADAFVPKAQPLLDWGNGFVSASQKTNAAQLPVAVLVNRQTAGAAEALAAVLRDAGVAVVIGTNTAGRAMIAEDFPLRNGAHLRIAKAGLKLGSGAVLSGPVKPDIEVAVSARDEQTYWADPFKDLGGANLLVTVPGGTNAASATNPAARLRINEADLIRALRERGALTPETVPAHRAEPEKPTVHDPALARALDLIKGLAVVRQMRK